MWLWGLSFAASQACGSSVVLSSAPLLYSEGCLTRHSLLSTFNLMPSWEWSIRRWDVCLCVCVFVCVCWGGNSILLGPNPHDNRSPWHFLCPCLSPWSFRVQGSQARPQAKQGKRATSGYSHYTEGGTRPIYLDLQWGS